MKFKRLLPANDWLEIEVREGTLMNVLDALSSEFGVELDRLVFQPETRKVKRSNLILVNGQSYMNLPSNLNTPLKDGDEVVFLPVLSGG